MRHKIIGTASLMVLAMACAAKAAPVPACGDNDSGDDLTSLYGDGHRLAPHVRPQADRVRPGR
ncbi:MAG: hypothetical protein WDN06_15765 [Asticcacaulis sp.]